MHEFGHGGMDFFFPRPLSPFCLNLYRVGGMLPWWAGIVLIRADESGALRGSVGLGTRAFSGELVLLFPLFLA